MIRTEREKLNGNRKNIREGQRGRAGEGPGSCRKFEVSGRIKVGRDREICGGGSDDGGQEACDLQMNSATACRPVLVPRRK